MLPKISNDTPSDGKSLEVIQNSISAGGTIRSRNNSSDDISTSLANMGSVKPVAESKEAEAVRSSRVSAPEVTQAKPDNLSAKKELPVNEKNLKMMEDENIFGLTRADRNIINKSVEDAPKQQNKLDMLVNKFTGGKVISFSELIFNNKVNQDKSITRLFSRKLKSYSDDLLDIIKKILKNLWNLIITKAQQFSDNIAEKWNSVKTSVVSGINNLLNLETKKSSVTKGDTGDTGVGLLDSIKSLFLIMSGDKAHQKKIKKEGFLSRLKSKVSKSLKGFGGQQNAEYEIGSDPTSNGADVNYGNIKTDGGLVNGGVVSKSAVYKALRGAGFGHGQALALTAEVGRENDFLASVLFANHKDPAHGNNIGMISWQGNRKAELIRRLGAGGVLRSKNPIVMDRTYQSLKIMADYIMYEMRSLSYATAWQKPMVKRFLANPNISYEEAAPLIGKGYVGWAYGQSTIRDPDRPGQRKAFDWKREHNKAVKYHKQTASELRGIGDADFGSLESKTAAADNRLKQAKQSKKLSQPQKYVQQSISQLTEKRADPIVYASNLGYQSPKITDVTVSSLGTTYNRVEPELAQQYHIPKQINTTIQSDTQRQAAQQPQESLQASSGSQIQNDNTSSSFSSSNLVPSFFDILMQRDITGNMF